jgi:YD repeat-containing protein
MTYNYSPTQNNGKIVSDTNGSYTYDSLNRLATGSGWNQTYTYDGFGNLASIAGTQANTITYNPATNQGYCADANGNSTTVPCAGGYYGYTYDIENRIVQTGTAGGILFTAMRRATSGCGGEMAARQMR